jgi:hypothetical protein
MIIWCCWLRLPRFIQNKLCMGGRSAAVTYGRDTSIPLRHGGDEPYLVGTAQHSGMCDVNAGGVRRPFVARACTRGVARCAADIMDGWRWLLCWLLAGPLLKSWPPACTREASSARRPRFGWPRLPNFSK